MSFKRFVIKYQKARFSMQKSILITGASRGIGKATSQKFLENGWKVYGTFFKSKNNLADLCKKYPNDFVAIGPYDFSNLKETTKFINAMSQHNFDAIFLNAGIFSENDDFINFDYADFENVMNCNFYSPMMTAIKLQNQINVGGSIILMSSNDSYSGSFASISYGASKGAIANVMKSLSVNFGKKKVRVNSIAPGAIDTDMNTSEQVNESPKWTPLARVAQPYEVANVVFFLAGEESSFVNGTNITIDGGYGNVSVLLQKEMESSRIYGGYKELIKRYEKMSHGESIFSIDVADSGYAWQNTKNERAYLDACMAAQERGVEFFRYIILPTDKIKAFKTNKLFEKYNKKTKNCFIISSEELQKKLPDVYEIVGKGCDVYVDKDKNLHSFIDFYSDDNCVGVLTDSEKITGHLYEKILKLKKAVENKTIETF